MTRRASRAVAGRRAACSAAAVGIAALLAPDSATADNLRCDGQNLRKPSARARVADFNGSSTPITGFNRTQAANGVRNSVARINDSTLFTFELGANTRNADTWNRTDLASIGAVGVTVFNTAPISANLDCRFVEDGEIIRARYFYNSAHVWEDADDYACTAIHEFLHGLGLAHTATRGSVMEVRSGFTHNNRCHGRSPRLELSADDFIDVNLLYK